MGKIELPEDDEDLIKECEISTFRSSGPGGQHVNKTDSAVRLIHLPTGITVTSQKERSQLLNKKTCLHKLREIVKRRNYVKPKRIKTKMPKSVKAKNVLKKTKHSAKKQLRQRPQGD